MGEQVRISIDDAKRLGELAYRAARSSMWGSIVDGSTSTAGDDAALIERLVRAIADAEGR